jgi:tripartite-type tricarboxylate transporter receptor subunit TctC
MNAFAPIALAALTLLSTPALAQDPTQYPSRPVRVIVPSTPGSPPDLIGRIVGEKLSAALGKPFVFENRPGATGVIGLETLARSPADGYTLGVISQPFVINASFVDKMPFDIEKDFAAVALVNWSYNFLSVRSDSKLKSIDELVAAAKANPGALKFSAMNATGSHLSGEIFKHEAGVDIRHIPYKGAPASALALLSGDVDIAIGPVGSISGYLHSGKVRALATTAPHRIAAFPDIPTFAELGYPEVQLRDWQGFLAPVGTPRAVIAHLAQEISKATAMPDVKARFEKLGMERADEGPDEFASHIHGEMQRWSKFVHQAGIKAD